MTVPATTIAISQCAENGLSMPHGECRMIEILDEFGFARCQSARQNNDNP
jgi:hypothetical protein